MNVLKHKNFERWLWWGALAVAVIATIVLLMNVRNDDCTIGSQRCFNMIQYTVNGLMVGGIYALVALGIVIINKASGIFNFAHGFMMLFGALVFWEVYHAIPSTELSVLIGVIAALIILNFFGPEGVAEGQTRLEKIQNVVSTRQFMIAAGVALAVGVVVALLLRQVNHDLIRAGIGGVITSIGLGLAVERFTIRPLLGQPVLTSIMMTLAIALVLQGAATLIWGTQPKSLAIFVQQQDPQVQRIPIGVDEEGNTIFQEIVGIAPPPSALADYTINLDSTLGGTLRLRRNLVWGFGVALACFTAFVLFFQFTGTGLAMRAVAENQTLAESVGLRVRIILAVAWAIAATMAMIAGAIQGSGPGVGVSLLVIPPLAFRAFPAVLLGGLESITGALIGGLIIGVVEQLVSALVDSTTGQEFAPFAVLLIVLLLKPDGLFGQKRIDRV